MSDSLDSKLDALIQGDGVSARLTALLLVQEKLAVARAIAGVSWRSRTVALPESTMRDLGFFGIERSEFARWIVPPHRRPPGRSEAMALIDERELLSLIESRLPLPPLEKSERAADDKRVQTHTSARVTIDARGAIARRASWISAGRLQYEAIRYESGSGEARERAPAHTFAMKGREWSWGVEESGGRTLLLTHAIFLDPEAAPLAFGALAAETNVMPRGAELERNSGFIELGVDPEPADPGRLLAGSTMAAIDPISSLGLRIAVRGAVRTALAARALVEGDLDEALVRRWHARAGAAEAALLLTLARASYAPLTPDAAIEDLLPAWARRLPRELALALSRQLATHHLMSTHAWLDSDFLAVDAPREHDGLIESAGRLAPIVRVGCPILGLPRAEFAALAPLLARFAQPIRARSVAIDQNSTRAMIRLFEGGALAIARVATVRASNSPREGSDLAADE